MEKEDLVSKESDPNLGQSILKFDGEKRRQEQGSPPPSSDRQDLLSFPHQLYPPQSYHTQAPSRTLQVDFTDWKGRHIHVSEAGPEAPVLYTVDIHMRKPNMVFKTGETGSTFATIDFPTFSSKIKAHIHGHEITLHVKMGLRSGFKAGITYESPALQSACLTWRSKSCFKIFDFECLDEKSVPLAQFTPHNSWSVKKLGRLELFGTRASSGVGMDEVVVTGLALAYYTLISVTSINVAAAV